jgi:hypothetical protein
VNARVQTQHDAGGSPVILGAMDGSFGQCHHARRVCPTLDDAMHLVEVVDVPCVESTFRMRDSNLVD